jgi:putative transposase
MSKRQRRNQSPAFQARVARQARALGINRGSVYYLPKPASIVELEIMRRMDALHLN